LGIGSIIIGPVFFYTGPITSNANPVTVYTYPVPTRLVSIGLYITGISLHFYMVALAGWWMTPTKFSNWSAFQKSMGRIIPNTPVRLLDNIYGMNSLARRYLGVTPESSGFIKSKTI
jgi:hypothetical protein